MAETNRRHFLGYLGTGLALSTAGCAAVDNIGEELAKESTPKHTTESEVNLNFSADEYVPVGIDDQVTIAQGHYKYWERDLTGELPTTISCSIIVREGPPIDFILTDEEEFQAMKEGQNWAYFEGTELQTSLVDDEGVIEDTEKLVIMLDNSNIAKIPDDDRSSIVDIEVSFE